MVSDSNYITKIVLLFFEIKTDIVVKIDIFVNKKKITKRQSVLKNVVC